MKNITLLSLVALLLSCTGTKYIINNITEINKAEKYQKNYTKKPLKYFLKDLKVKPQMMSYAWNEIYMAIIKFDDYPTYKAKRMKGIYPTSLIIAFEKEKYSLEYFRKIHKNRKDSLALRYLNEDEVKTEIKNIENFKIAYIMSSSEHQKKE